MWVLLLFVMTLSSSGPTTLIISLKRDGAQPLHETLESCESERTRITEEMQKSYPGDTDYRLECQKVPKKSI